MLNLASKFKKDITRSVYQRYMSSANIGAIYQHYKGAYYRVIAIGKHTETEEKMVVYRAVTFASVDPLVVKNEDSNVWIRPYDMFCSKIDNEMRSRFTYVAQLSPYGDVI